MKILSVAEPFLEIPYLNAGPRGTKCFVDQLPIHRGKVSCLPDDLAAIVVTADLQGRDLAGETADGIYPLLGESLPARLTGEILPNLNLPAGQVAAILAGDFYSLPKLQRRGGTGDVTEVWQAFANQFHWVAGVAGNHDQFGNRAYPKQLAGNAHFLDGESVRLGSKRFVGVGGIIGNPNKNWRHTTDQYIEEVECAAMMNPDVMILHDGPDHPFGKGKGSPLVRELLEICPPMLVIRGHAHWDDPLAMLVNGTQVLNVDARCIILTE